MKRYAVFAAVMLMLAGFSAHDLRREMIALDKIYIAALALTNQGKVEESRKAVQSLQQAWDAFKSRHYGANPADTQWQPDFDAVGKRVASAVMGVSGLGADLAQAHEALEEVRNVMMSLRLRNRIDYYIDKLTAFHHPMEDIALAAKDKTAQTLSDADISKIRATLPQAEKLWRAVETSKPDAAVYQLSAAQADDVAKLVNLESAALAALNSALASGDKAQIAKAAAAIKPNFAKLFVTFANFEPYR